MNPVLLQLMTFLWLAIGGLLSVAPVSGWGFDFLIVALFSAATVCGFATWRCEGRQGWGIVGTSLGFASLVGYVGLLVTV
jgi:serine protease inhibitor ecotin